MASSTTLAPSAAPTTNRLVIDSKRFTAILSKRTPVKIADVGEQLVLQVQGDGQFLAQGYEYVGRAGKTENMFDRWIYNVKANSELSMKRPENRKLLLEAMKAESAGDTEKASELFNEYLNAVQVSFSVIANAGQTARKFSNGDLIKGIVALVETKAGEKQLVLETVSLKPAVVREKTTYAISDLIDLEDVEGED